MRQKIELKKDYLQIAWLTDVEFSKDKRLDLKEVYINRLHAAFYRQQIDKIEVKYPANWIEAVKERFLPKFLQKCVKYTCKVIHADRVFGNVAKDLDLPAVDLMRLGGKWS